MLVFPEDFTAEEKFIAESVQRAHAKSFDERFAEHVEEKLLKALEEKRKPAQVGFKIHEEVGMGIVNTKGVRKISLQTSPVVKPGTFIAVSKPEYVGKFPSTQPRITKIDIDKPSRKLNMTWKTEYAGKWMDYT